MSNIVEAIPRVGTIFRTKPVYQYDVGQIIHLSGITLPVSYRVEFSNSARGSAVTTVQTGEYVVIPASMLQSGNPVYVWIVTVDENSRTTEYQLMVPVIVRAQTTDPEPDVEEQSAIDQAIAALNSGVTRATNAASAAASAASAATSAASHAVWYDEAQSLTDSQKAQARANIDAGAGLVSYDASQTLTTAQKQQVHTNIGLEFATVTETKTYLGIA